jgi:hypothetical protein
MTLRSWAFGMELDLGEIMNVEYNDGIIVFMRRDQNDVWKQRRETPTNPAFAYSLTSSSRTRRNSSAHNSRN